MGDMACEPCEVNNCYELVANETVTCTEIGMLCEPCVCRRTRRYLRMMDIDNVQMQCKQQLCNASCDEGFVGDNVIYLCNDSHNYCTPTSDQEIICERGLVVLKIMLE